MKKNPAFENSLACLQHPLTLLSIAVLLLNDHVLKIVSPSWLTGKLSDFAGLFFFPFIVAAGLSLFLSKFNLSRARIGQIAFWWVAVWFVLLKTSLLVNSLTAQFASLFIGAPTRLILDPTDLIALVSMWPSWMMWKQTRYIKLTRFSYVALSIGALAAIATSPPVPPFDNIVALAYQEKDALFVKGSLPDQFSQSTDNGRTWMALYSLPNLERAEKAFNERQAQVEVCDPIMLGTCYKIEGKDQVLISNDDGTSWQVAWEILPDRREYVTRISGNMETHDLMIVEYHDSRYLFVAAGRYGVLRKQLPDGEWTPLAVEEAEPVQVMASDFLSAIYITNKELIIWVVVSYLSLLTFHVALWYRINSNTNATYWILQTIVATVAFTIVEAVVAFGIFLIVVAIGLFFPAISLDSTDQLTVPAIVFVIVLFVWLVTRTNHWILKTAPNLSKRRKLVFYCALSVASVLVLGSLPWPLWALGIIVRYQSALLISVFVSVLITIFGCFMIRNAK